MRFRSWPPPPPIIGATWRMRTRKRGGEKKPRRSRPPPRCVTQIGAAHFNTRWSLPGSETKTSTIEQLQQMAGVGPVRMGFTLNSPEFAFLGGDLRVKALRKQVGLPE